MKLTIKNIEKWAERQGLKIVIGHPSEWGIVCKEKRAYSFAIQNQLGLWESPTEIQCYSLKTLLSDLTHLVWRRVAK